jgi:hypothetical protein
MRRVELGIPMIAKIQASACAALLAFGGVADARELQTQCASAAEISAIQVEAVHEELSDASLACGDRAVDRFNQFQKRFLTELRRSDALMLSMFKRLYGVAKGNAAYDAYKTRAIAHAEQRRTIPGAAENFCKAADIVFAAALAPDKPVLEDFVAGVPVEESSPVDSCEIKVTVALQGVAAAPSVMPTPRPDLPGDPPQPGLFP